MALLLTTSLVARIQHSHHGGQTAISGQEPKSHFKELHAEAAEDQLHDRIHTHTHTHV